MKVLVLIAVLASSVCAHHLGRLRAAPGGRIIGGGDANAGEFPFAAAIQTQTSTGQYFCGGALVNTLFIVTSGSCVDGATLFSIRLGITSLAEAGQRLATDKYVLHPLYNIDTLENDIGVIELRLPVSFTDYIQPIGLPGRDVQDNAVAIAIGWGQISDADAGLTNQLQTVELVALSNEECRLTFGNQIADTMVCVDGNYNEGACLGDVGGPLIQYVNGHQATIVGISSFISGHGCESTDPSGYTRAFPFVEWIQNNTKVPS